MSEEKDNKTTNPATVEECLTELEQLRAAMIDAEKMAALGQLIAGIAHEIKTPLAALRSNTDLFIRSVKKLREVVSPDTIPDETRRAEFTKLLDNMISLNSVNKDASDRIVRIVNSLRRFARAEDKQVEEGNIHEWIDTTLTLVEHEFKNRIDIERDYGDLPRFSCVIGEVNQVLMNILVNAGHAIEGKGKVTIRTRLESDSIILEISDTGHGIPPENLDRIFDPGFTTKSSGQGTGLGLSIVKRIVEDHGGKIEVESEVGKGTTFKLIFPNQTS